MSILWEAGGITDVGRQREGNEDTFFLDADRGIFVVADGMGGHAAGEVASGLAVRSVAEALTEAVDAGVPAVEISGTLAGAFRMAWEELAESGRSDPSTEGMGTTLTACLLAKEGWCRIAHIGDSRLYRFRAGDVELLTEDHTWVQREIESGRLHPDAAETHPFAHVLTRVLCADLPPEPDLIATTVDPGDVLLLSSDGLHGLVATAELRKVATHDGPLQMILSHLVDLANSRGGRDNITALVIRIRSATNPG